MPKCIMCKSRYKSSQLDMNNVCRACNSEMQMKAERQRKVNLSVLKEGRAKPAAQRVFDAFVKDYPDAFLTGIGVYDEGEKLRIYLDGMPKYDATLDLLTGKVKLVPYIAPDITPSTPSPEKNHSGCLKSFLIALAVLFAMIYVFNNQTDPSDKSSAPKATASPTSTAPADDILSWVSYYADTGKGDDVVFRSAKENTSAGEKILVIEFYLNPMSKNKYYRLAAAQTILNVGSSIRSKKLHKNYDSINFLFYGGFVDKYGNKTESLGIRAWYEDYEFEKLNFDFFKSTLYSDPDAIIKAADEYIIHRLYQD